MNTSRPPAAPPWQEIKNGFLLFLCPDAGRRKGATLPLCWLMPATPLWTCLPETLAAANCSRPASLQFISPIVDGHSIIESATNTHLKNSLKIILIGVTIFLDIDVLYKIGENNFEILY